MNPSTPLAAESNPTRAKAARRAVVLVYLALLVPLVACKPVPETASPKPARSWVTTWTASPQPTWEAGFALSTRIPRQVSDASIRQIVRISLGGSRASFVFSNAYGTKALRIGSATVATASKGAGVVTDSLRRLHFAGASSVTIPPGARVLSDPLPFTTDDLARLAITIHLPETTELSTFHWDGLETTYFTEGDATHAQSFETTRTTPARHFLTRILVETPNRGVVAVLGDSVTDGNGTTPGMNRRWPDRLAERLVPHRVAVVNAGISGNRLLAGKMGESGLARFDRDVISLAGLRGVIVALGTNDVGWPGTAFAPDSGLPAFEQLTLAYRQLAARAHLHRVTSVVATLPPFEGALSDTAIDGYYSASKDALRVRLNDWMRATQWFDHVLDVDQALRDPQRASRMAERYDSGDHLHPGDLGAETIAHAVQLPWFTSNGAHPCQPPDAR